MSRRRPATVHGVAVVDKPAGLTSHDVVGLLRRRFGERRIGHAGTLDPGATGVLVVGVGNVTRLLRFVGDGRKRYLGEVVLGVETDTLDADGTVTARHDMAGVTVEAATGGGRRAPDGTTSSRCRRWSRRSTSVVAGCTSWLARAWRSSVKPGP